MDKNKEAALACTSWDDVIYLCEYNGLKVYVEAMRGGGCCGIPAYILVKDGNVIETIVNANIARYTEFTKQIKPFMNLTK